MLCMDILSFQLYIMEQKLDQSQMGDYDLSIILGLKSQIFVFKNVPQLNKTLIIQLKRIFHLKISYAKLY